MFPINKKRIHVYLKYIELFYKLPIEDTVRWAIKAQMILKKSMSLSAPKTVSTFGGEYQN